MKISAGIFGASGYTGIELARLLLEHPHAELTALNSRAYAGGGYENLFGSLKSFTHLECEESSIADFAERCDVVFLALPHGIAAKEINPSILERTLIVDLGADYRLKDRKVYEQWYGITHESPELIETAQYGLCELYREKIAGTPLIANPGCYTTASITALAPLYKEGIIELQSTIIDAKSGVTGAGRTPSQALHFSECNESIKAYKVEGHRHTPEIEQALSECAGMDVITRFTPHLVPMNRGILASCYARPAIPLSSRGLHDLYERHYSGEPFIRLLEAGTYPHTRWVRGSNFIDISIDFDERSNTIVALSALDNLVKGAAGQAVQNMNIHFGFEETEGLMQIPLFP
ncbi:MAG: N-acetyl-gamma-glutamyl-phosphate reductase [Spirochaetaceae bacterium]